MKILTLIAVLSLAISCSKNEKKLQLIDKNAEEQTSNLYQNLKKLEGKHTLFGHQATLAYGYSWRNEPNRSDVKDVTGDFPALYGWDIADFVNLNDSEIEMEEKMLRIKNFVKEGYDRGGVIAFAWHMSNPATGKSFYDTTSAVHSILPGGENHHILTQNLDAAARFFKEVSPIPIIFRPWHEHNGDWFWWCKGPTKEEDYIKLWQFTVDYLKNEKQIHNLIYAFSPDRSRMSLNDENAYFYAYPGDEYVDIIGLDNYWDVGHPVNTASPAENAQNFAKSLELIAKIATNKNKIAALTETGMEAIPDSTWWTQIMLKGIETNDWTKKITYFQVWRNATKAVEKKDHYYAPFKGQVSENDFLKMVKTDRIMLESELPKMYKK